IGMRGRFGHQLDYDITAFWVDVSDELVPYQLNDDSDRTFYRNAGATIRKGIELALIWRPGIAWRVESALTLARYTFDDHETDAGDFDGRRLPGIPQQTWHTEWMWSADALFFA